jgi:hypothetical protein
VVVVLGSPRSIPCQQPHPSLACIARHSESKNGSGNYTLSHAHPAMARNAHNVDSDKDGADARVTLISLAVFLDREAYYKMPLKKD